MTDQTPAPVTAAQALRSARLSTRIRRPLAARCAAQRAFWAGEGAGEDMGRCARAVDSTYTLDMSDLDAICPMAAHVCDPDAPRPYHPRRIALSPGRSLEIAPGAPLPTLEERRAANARARAALVDTRTRPGARHWDY